MASPAPGRDVPNASPRDEPGPNHPEPACLEAQKWIEAVTGKSFGDKDFRSGLENGILLCELLSAIKPGLVKKINRLPTPIAGLDNLSVFLRGCEEFGLKGSQLFDPGDLQDTSTRANLKDCNRKIKNVLNTVFWLGKAAGGCASYSGPTLNLKEFEGLLAQMKVESEDSSQMRSVRDSGYDCWDSERSDSLSPPRHTRDDSLDSLDSFGSRSQHSPSPDVANRGNGDGRGSDSEADAPSRRPDVRKDDMLARRTASSESRVSIPFNQFLPNRTNNSSYIPTPRRKPHTEEGEQRSHPQAPSEQCKRTGLHHKTPKSVTWAPEDNGEEVKQEEEKVTQEVLEQKTLQKLEKTGIKDLPAAVRFSSPPTLEEQEVRSPSPNIILRCDNDFLSSQKSAWDSSSDVEEEADARKVPDVRKDDLASRRAPRGPVAPRVHQFVPQPVCSSKDRERWEGIRRASQQSLQEKEISEKEAVPDIMTRRDNPFLNSAPRHEDGEDGEEEEGKVTATPNKQKDDLARRRAQSKPLPQRDGPVSLVSASMSQADMQKWKRLKMTEPSEACPSSPVCQACLETNVGDPFSGPAKAGRSQSKVVTFGGVTEIEQPVDTVMSSEGEEKELLRRLLSKATVAMPTIGLGSQLSERERSQVDGADLNQTTPPSAVLPLCSPESPSPPAEMDTRLAHYERRTDGGEEEDDDDEEEDKIPDPQKDDMMARRTGVFHKQSTAPVTYNRFLPLPSTKRCTQGEVATDAAPRNKRDVQAARSKELNARSFSHSVRAEQHPPRVPMETPQLHPDTTAIRATSHSQFEYEDDDGDEYDENEPEPDLEKDDMMARRTRSFQKTDAARTNKPINRFLPVPGSVKYNVAPVSAMKPLRNRLKLTEKLATESVVAMVAEPQALLSKAPTLPKCAGPRERQAEGGKQEGGVATPQSSVTGVTEPLSSPSLTPPPLRPAAARACKVEAELGNQGVEERVEETVEEREKDVNREPRRKPFWLDDDDLPPIMSVSMSDILNEEEVEHLPPLSQSRYERRHEQSNNFQDDDDHWQSELARWKNRRRSTSQELIKKEEERKRMEKRMKEEGSGSNKRKSIKTYKEILEEKERRESELCDAYRNAATPEEASVVLQRYALRFTISDATLDSLKLPRYPANPKQDLHPADREHKTTSPTNESSQPPNKLEPPVIKDQSHAEPGEMKTDVTAQQETSVSSSSPAAGGPLGPVTNSENVPPQSLEVNEPRSKPTPTTRPKQPIAGDAKPQPKHSEAAHVPPHSTRPGHALPSPPSVAPRPVPLLAAKPYCQPRSAQSGHKPVKMDGLVRVNGEVKVDLSVSTSPTSACHSPPEVKDNPSKMMEKDVPSEKTGKDVPSEKTMKDVPSEKTVKNVPLEQTEKDVPPEQISAYQETVEETPSPQTERSSSSLGSAISSLIGGRNCIITTTIVTELTHVEPHQPDSQSNAQVNGTSGFSESPVEGKKAPPASPPNRMQESSPTVTEGLEESSVTIETPMLNLAKRVNHWVWDPNEERKRLESWQQEQERLLQEQYQREQEKLKKEWEKAQLEVQEEGRKHNEEERRILEETVQPLNQTGFVNQQSGQMGTTSSAPEHNQTERGNVAPQQNGQSTSTGNEGQHVSKLHFLQDSACDGEPLMKQELWKTASLDRNPQLNQAHIAQRSESHGAVTNKQQPSALSPQPPSHSRSVSGKRLCSGCSQPLEKGAAMIIDTLGLFFHIQCFKCGACKGQLGDATAGTDVRIRNGLLSCHECYIASRGRGQPTTL
ncbi:LIM and calponin homology domains-containing protein 1-like isoform X4 [Pseudoliparis swirei]|uniref:LIM and calponin homology domains-containing protein 1-like isoform X4 n=1 Tax=Pseudoliparis swirei TaxID=2059687 RepID=UPI0024BDF7AE|nr:LIM and calponin homology domains-containing protein 1-like isoform X4 [Pseudoliparis swirei]